MAAQPSEQFADRNLSERFLCVRGSGRYGAYAMEMLLNSQASIRDMLSFSARYLGFRFKPSMRVENACATGSAAVRHAVALIEYEAMGLTEAGEGAHCIGRLDRTGRIAPYQFVGRSQSPRGQPVGATGVSMHVMSAMQLAGTTPGVHSPPTRGGVFNMGGTAVVNYVSILERVR